MQSVPEPLQATGESDRPGSVDPDKSPAYSPSKLQTALGCPALYEFESILKLPQRKKASIEVGNWIDDVLNVYWNHRLHLGVEHPLSDLLAYADITFEKYRDRVPEWDLATAPDVIAERMQGAIETYTMEWGQRLIPISVQGWAHVPAGVVGRLRVHGKPDLIARDTALEGSPIVVVDHKAKNDGFYAEKNPEAKVAAERDLRMNLKMMLYAAGLGMAGTPPAELRLIGLIYTKEPKVQTVAVRPTRQSVQWALHAAQQGARIIEGGKFYPNPFYVWCSGCQFTRECNERYGSGE